MAWLMRFLRFRLPQWWANSRTRRRSIGAAELRQRDRRWPGFPGQSFGKLGGDDRRRPATSAASAPVMRSRHGRICGHSSTYDTRLLSESLQRNIARSVAIGLQGRVGDLAQRDVHGHRQRHAELKQHPLGGDGVAGRAPEQPRETGQHRNRADRPERSATTRMSTASPAGMPCDQFDHSLQASSRPK